MSCTIADKYYYCFKERIMYQKQRVIIFIIFTIAVVCMSACGQKKDIYSILLQIFSRLIIKSQLDRE